MTCDTDVKRWLHDVGEIELLLVLIHRSQNLLLDVRESVVESSVDLAVYVSEGVLLLQ